MNVEIQDCVLDINESLKSAADLDLSGRISGWLSPPDPSSNLESAQEKQQHGTGLWLLNSPVYLEWKKTGPTFLWLFGKAGSGKSVLSSTVINSLTNETNQNNKVIYFYFDFQVEEKQLVLGLLSAIVVQALEQSKHILKTLGEFYGSHLSGFTKPTIQASIQIVRKILNELPPVYLVIDALDECKERKRLLAFLVELRRWNETNIHVLVTSRREIDIENALGPIATQKISLEESVVDEDILTYVRHQLQHDPDLMKWPEEMRKDIETTLLEGANGMFRWVECQLDAIRGCMKPAHLRRTLKSLPRTLDDTYARILDNIHEDYVEDVCRILSCLICSFYPLAIQEIAETIAIESEGERFYDSDNRLCEPRDILTMCSGLVTTNKSRRITLMGWAQIPIEELRLAHFSVKEYLISDRILRYKASKFHLEERLTHESLARLCIRYLRYCHEADLCGDPEFLPGYENSFLKKAAFAPYAAAFWHHHLTEARLNSSSPFYRECFAMITHPALLWDIIRLRRPWFNTEQLRIMRGCGYMKTIGGNNWYNFDFPVVPPLYYACLLGMDRFVDMLLAEGQNVDSSTYEGTCLTAAVSSGNRYIVKSLLASGADINLVVLQLQKENEIRYSRSAIHEAIYNSDTEIPRILLEAGADVNINRWALHTGDRFMEDSNTPLQAAVHNADTPLIQLLIDAGADPNAPEGRWGTPLDHALNDDTGTEILTILLDAGADPNLPSETKKWTFFPINKAICRANLAGARLLIKRGASPMAIGGGDIKAMIANCIENRTRFGAMVQLLLEIRPDLNYGPILIGAAKLGYCEVLEILVHHNVNLDSQDRSGTTALHGAAFTTGCDTEAVQILLDAGAYVGIEGEAFGTALQAAAMAGKRQVAKMLLEKGIPVNHPGGEHGTALKVAKDRLEDKKMDCPEVWRGTTPSRGNTSFGNPKSYFIIDGHADGRYSPYWKPPKSPKDEKYVPRINIAHLPYADYQGIIDLLIAHGASP